MRATIDFFDFAEKVKCRRDSGSRNGFRRIDCHQEHEGFTITESWHLP